MKTDTTVPTHNHYYQQGLAEQTKPPSMVPMTVGIAAICDSGRSIVIASDRMRTFGEQFEVELDEPKIEYLTPNVLMACSSSEASLHLLYDNIDDIRSELSGMTTKLVARRVWEVMRSCKREKSSNHTKRLLDMSFSELRDSARQAALPSTMDKIFAEAVNMQWQVHLLICGVDRDEATIYLVTEDSVASLNHRAYGGIGSGWLYAVTSLVHRKYSRSASLASALYYVYESKRVAEIALGVGRITDIAILRSGKTPVIIGDGHPLITLLDSSYAGLRLPEPSDRHLNNSTHNGKVPMLRHAWSAA